MSGMARIEELVEKGLVLDERGAWIPIAEKVAREREFLSHLEKGEVLLERQWVSIERFKTRQNTAGTTTSAGSGSPAGA